MTTDIARLKVLLKQRANAKNVEEWDAAGQGLLRFSADAFISILSDLERAKRIEEATRALVDALRPLPEGGVK